MYDCYVETNGIRLHYLHFTGDGPTLFLMHGLTANAHAFDGLMAGGLVPAYNVISIDLRGRGESDQPPTGYTLEEHAKDIIGLLDYLKVDRAIIGGHSFGALLTFYLARYYPERIDKMIILDAAVRMNERTKEMLGPAMSRLGQRFPSFEIYLNKVKQAPYLHFWDEHMLSYYRADVKVLEDGSIICIPQLHHMVEAVNGVLAEPMTEHIQYATQPAILINGPGVYTMNAALLPKENALETVHLMKDCSYVEVPGNHQTMLYGEGAMAIVKALKQFLEQ
jgi:pimeloyl-ACP methyl ester carboxylesterase